MHDSYYNVEQVARIANSEFLGPNGLRSADTLSSSFSSFHYYDSDELRISSIFLGLIKNHPFLDANKRTSAVVLFYLVENVGLSLDKTEEQMFDLIVSVASTKLTVEQVADLLFR